MKKSRMSLVVMVIRPLSEMQPHLMTQNKIKVETVLRLGTQQTHEFLRKFLVFLKVDVFKSQICHTLSFRKFAQFIHLLQLHFSPAGNLEKKRKTPHKQSTSSKVAKTVYANRKLGRPPCQSQHKKQFSCTICEYSSSRRLDFENHMRTHTGEKPYRCDRCGKRCTTAQWLKKHVVIHTDVFPFYCGGCFSRFSLKSEKEAHLKVCKVRRYECYLCDKFKSGGKDHMIQHMRSHTGEKPFRCEVCMKCFTLKCTLNRHLDTVHTRVNA